MKKEWWVTGPRVEHLIDVALPHEDNEPGPSQPEPTGMPLSSAVLLAAFVLIMVGIAIYIIVSTAQFWS